jgi:phosphatidate phosphatase APP1
MIGDHAMRRWPVHLVKHLQDVVAGADDLLDAARRRFDAKFSRHRPQHIAAYRGYADESGAELSGRILADPPLGGPKQDDAWWDNLWNTYRRFESDEVAHAGLKVSFRGASAATVSDAEGYYRLHLPTGLAPSDLLWDDATVQLADGTLATLQPVLQVGPAADFGVISDIDDTVLESRITDWKLAAQLLFLHNARTRKPLQGLAALYQALQRGARGDRRNPIFYVSSSPWNLYDLLDDFMDLNAIPSGPMFLRDMGLDRVKSIGTRGHRHKLERVRELVHRLPQLRWLLVGDSGQADAELYAEAAQEFGDRILAIYIRDVDLAQDSARDRYVDGFIERIAGTRVPMLRVADSSAIAAHALGLGLIAQSALSGIAAEVGRDEQRPTLDEAAAPLAP